MNIFKILANGHGTINENNISAFLGYLLDPSTNSLGYEFLIRFLGDILEKNEKYEFKIFFEQEFRDETKTKKEVVDIVIVCYQTNNSILKKSFVKDFIQNKKSIKKIILIENKINSGAKNIGQLDRQYKSTIDELVKIEKNIKKIDIHSIYVTPDNDGFTKEFENFKKEVNPNAFHIIWKENSSNSIEDKKSIKEILETILLLENQAKIDPINEYTKHTLKSFIQFIETDFKSEKEVKRDRKNDGKYTQEFVDLNNQSNIESRLIDLKDSLISMDLNINKYTPYVSLKNVRFPNIYFLINDLKVSIFSSAKNPNSIRLIFRINNEYKETTKKSLEKLANKLDIDIKTPNGYSYCFTNEMNKHIPLHKVDEVLKTLKMAIKEVENL